jgi:YfiR/HmsC-like
MRARPITTWLRGTLMLLPVVLAAAATGAHAQDTEASSEYLIKAGFIYNFASLVQWPSTSFSQADSPIVIAVLGEDHFGTTLDHVLQGKKIDGRPFVIRRLRSVSELVKSTGNPRECQILYVTSSAMSRLSEAIQSVRGLPILTIGEMPGFAKSGGMINLVLEDNRVRFEVNVKAAKDADLNISSRLLALARIVQPPESDGRKAE